MKPEGRYFSVLITPTVRKQKCLSLWGRVGMKDREGQCVRPWRGQERQRQGRVDKQNQSKHCQLQVAVFCNAGLNFHVIILYFFFFPFIGRISQYVAKTHFSLCIIVKFCCLLLLNIILFEEHFMSLIASVFLGEIFSPRLNLRESQ